MIVTSGGLPAGMDEKDLGMLDVNNWRDKEATRDAVKAAINDFLYSDATGLPESAYSEMDVVQKSQRVFEHIFVNYPYLPSPVYQSRA